MNNNQQLIKTLTNIGLSEKEAKIFLACTKEGTSPVSQIAKTADINRVTTYDILEKLKQKGLVSYYTKKKIKYFTSIAPETLLEEFESRTQNLRSTLPKLKALQGEINHPRVRYFEGLDGIKAIYSDTLTSQTEILNFSNSAEIRKAWPTYDQDYVAKRAKKKIFLKGIAPKDSEGETVKQEDEKYQREMRLISTEQFDFTNEINIYDDKVAIISFKEELIGMIIESHEIAHSQRTIFQMCWEFADIQDKLQKEIKDSLLKPIKENPTNQKPEKIKTKEEKAQKEKEGNDMENLSLF